LKKEGREIIVELRHAIGVLGAPDANTLAVADCTRERAFVTGTACVAIGKHGISELAINSSTLAVAARSLIEMAFSFNYLAIVS